MAYIGEKYSKSSWTEGLTSGMEQRIEALEDKMAELQSYVAEQTPFVDEEQVPEPLFDNDRGDLIDALKVAHKGLKPGATATQNNIAYYAVRGILSQEED